MCGFYFSFPIEESNINGLLQQKSAEISAVKLRGLDDFRIDSFHNSLNVFSRLAIRSLQDGVQPYQNEKQGFVSAVNGELFNEDEIRLELHQHGCQENEIPKGDTQIIAFAISVLGLGVISRFRGQFAGYIYSYSNKEIIFFRDHVGEKPLFYRKSGEMIEFSSSPSIFPKNDADFKILQKVLLLGYVPEGEALSGWRELPPGSCCLLKLDQEEFEIIPIRFWRWPKVKKEKGFSGIDPLIIEIRNAVSRQLISDVPYCSFISGGIDSAVVAKMISELHGSHFDSFSLHFKDSKYSEIKAAETVAKSIGCNFNSIEVSPEDLAANIDECLASMPYPFIDSGSLSLFTLTKGISDKFKVALTGDGGDELFGGYLLADKEHSLLTARRFRPLAKYFIKLLVKLIEDDSDSYLSYSMKLRRALTVIENQEFDVPAVALSPISGTHLFGDFISDNSLAKVLPRQGIDSKSYYRNVILPRIYLPKSDRMGMANSVEIRSPLLDVDLIEFVTTSMGLKMPYPKYFLKEIGKRFLPKEIIWAKKHGFSSPMHEVLKYYPKPDWKLDILGIDREIADNFWKKACSGDQNMGILCWGLLVINSYLFEV
jgi:asparagine synthase (glutamine-hydrolysing)